MKSQTALVLGATGLIGSRLVSELLEDEAFEKVIVMVRNDYPVQHPKLVVRKVDFSSKDDFQQKIGTGDSIFCCIGTTMKKVKNDKATYKKIDYDIALDAANFGFAAGYKQYLLVSSIGANASSKNFYLRLKGELENVIHEIPFEGIHIFQPSMLLGDRKEFRAGELVGKILMKALGATFVGPLKKFKAIDALHVARGMLEASKRNSVGIGTYTYTDIIRLGKGS